MTSYPPDAGAERYRSIRYTWLDGIRHRIGLRRSVRPLADESGPAFEQRMARLVNAWMAQGFTAITCEIEYDDRTQRIVRCSIVGEHTPVPAPVEPLQAQSGGKPLLKSPRGARGRKGGR